MSTESHSNGQGFSDHFSKVATGYAEFRPHYPDALFDALKIEVDRIGRSSNDNLIWDCAAGTGQASIPLGDRFANVIATDASSVISKAKPHKGVHYARALAERCPLRDETVSLVTIAQALHWFRFDEFWNEVKRVLVPNGLVVAWSYGLLRFDDNKNVEQLIDEFSERTVGAWWPAERAHVNEGYARIPFPFERISFGPFDMSASFTRAQLVGYLRTWSSVSRKKVEFGVDPVVAFEPMLAEAWGSADTLKLRWPLTLLAGRKS